MMLDDPTHLRRRERQAARLAVLAVLSLAGWGCVAHRVAPIAPTLPRVTPSVDAGSIADAVLAAHNAERARRGLPPVRLDTDLTTAAQSQADDMARRGRMGHRGGDGSSPFDRIERTGYTFRAAGENVAAGFDSVAEVMAGWMRSRGHRANILGTFDEIGVGRAVAPGGATYWCVTFGSPRAVVSSSSSRGSAMIPMRQGDRSRRGTPGSISPPGHAFEARGPQCVMIPGIRPACFSVVYSA